MELKNHLKKSLLLLIYTISINLYYTQNTKLNFNTESKWYYNEHTQLGEMIPGSEKEVKATFTIIEEKKSIILKRDIYDDGKYQKSKYNIINFVEATDNENFIIFKGVDLIRKEYSEIIIYKDGSAATFSTKCIPERCIEFYSYY